MFDTIVKILITVALIGILLAILPASPFLGMLDEIAALPYLGYLNWFFPVGKCITALGVWASAVAIFYGISWILRQLDIIGG